MLQDKLHIYGPLDDFIEMDVSSRLVDPVDMLIGEIPDSRRKQKTEAIEKGKYFLRITCCVGGMFEQRQFGLIVQNGIQDIGGVSYR